MAHISEVWKWAYHIAGVGRDNMPQSDDDNEMPQSAPKMSEIGCFDPIKAQILD